METPGRTLSRRIVTDHWFDVNGRRKAFRLRYWYNLLSVTSNTHIMFKNIFANLAVYEIMWNIMVQLGRPQKTV